MKRIACALLFVLLACISVNATYIGGIDSTLNTAVSHILFCWSSTGQQADCDSAWYYFYRLDATDTLGAAGLSTTAANHMVFRRCATKTSTELDSAWVHTHNLGGGTMAVANRVFFFKDVARDMLITDGTPATDTMYTGRYSGCIALWAGGYRNENWFEWTVSRKNGAMYGDEAMARVRADSANVTMVAGDIVQDNADGRLEVNLEEIVDAAVSTTTAQLGVNVVTLTDGAIDNVDVDDDVNVNVASITDGTIVAADIATDAITAAKIAADAIGASEIASAAIAADEIATDAIGAAEIASAAIAADEIATDAIGAAEIAADALTSAEMATGAIGSTEFSAEDDIWVATGGDSVLQSLDYTNNANEVMRIAGSGRDSLYAITNRSSDTVMQLLNFSATVNANVVDWNSLALALTASGGYPDINVRAAGSAGQTAAGNGLAEAFDNDNVFATGGFEAVVDSINPAQKGQQSDSTWGAGHSGSRELTALDEDVTTLDLNATTVGAVAGLADTMRDVLGDTLNATSGKMYVAFVDGLGDTIRDVVGDTFNVVGGKVPVTFVDGLGDTLRDVVGDTFNVVGGKVPVTFVDGLGDTLRDVIGDTLNSVSGLVLADIRRFDEDDATIDLNATTIGTVANVSGLADTMRDVIGDTLNATSGKVYVAFVDGLADTVRDVLGDTVNAVSGKLWTDAGDSIRAHAPHDNNWGGTGGGGGGGCTSCGTGAQALTIVVIDTSGVDATVPFAFITIQNSAQTSIIAYGTANSSGSLSGLFTSASTAYKGIGISNGFYFPTYSFTTGSGASHTDTIRGYDIPTSAGSAVPSSQQVQLYDWAISPANDTLYGAKVTITLAGSSNFYTSSHLVPAASVVLYAGINDGTSNGGKWQETIFGTDSLSAPGGQTATYNVEIEHALLDLSGQKISYTNLVIPANALAAKRLRDVVAGQ